MDQQKIGAFLKELRLARAYFVAGAALRAARGWH